jgi:hypothetical protein
MAYLFSQWTTNVQINYCTFDWSTYRLFVLNRGWKRDSLQIMIFVFLCSTWIIFELITRFEAWITRNDVNGVCLFSFLIINTYGFPVLTKENQMSKSSFLFLIGRSTDHLCQIRAGNVNHSKSWYSYIFARHEA